MHTVRAEGVAKLFRGLETVQTVNPDDLKRYVKDAHMNRRVIYHYEDTGWGQIKFSGKSLEVFA